MRAYVIEKQCKLLTDKKPLKSFKNGRESIQIYQDWYRYIRNIYPEPGSWQLTVLLRVEDMNRPMNAKWWASRKWVGEGCGSTLNRYIKLQRNDDQLSASVNHPLKGLSAVRPGKAHAGDSLPHICPWRGGGAVLQTVSVASHKLGGPTHGRWRLCGPTHGRWQLCGPTHDDNTFS